MVKSETSNARPYIKYNQVIGCKSENVCFLNLVRHCISKLKNLFQNLRTYALENFRHFHCERSDILMVDIDRTISFHRFFKI